MVGDLQDVDSRVTSGAQPSVEQLRIDVLLDVPGEQHAALAGTDVENDRDVVDALAAVGRHRGDAARKRPEDAETCLVDGQPIAGDEALRNHAAPRELRRERRVAGTWSAHPGFRDRSDPVSGQEEREATGVVLVWVRQHGEVEAPVPRREPRVEKREEPVRVRPCVDEHPGAAPSLEQHRVPLADVEDRKTDPSVGAGGCDEDEDREGAEHQRCGESDRTR